MKYWMIGIKNTEEILLDREKWKNVVAAKMNLNGLEYFY